MGCAHSTPAALSPPATHNEDGDHNHNTRQGGAEYRQPCRRQQQQLQQQQQQPAHPLQPGDDALSSVLSQSGSDRWLPAEVRHAAPSSPALPSALRRRTSDRRVAFAPSPSDALVHLSSRFTQSAASSGNVSTLRSSSTRGPAQITPNAFRERCPARRVTAVNAHHALLRQHQLDEPSDAPESGSDLWVPVLWPEGSPARVASGDGPCDSADSAAEALPEAAVPAPELSPAEYVC